MHEVSAAAHLYRVPGAGSNSTPSAAKFACHFLALLSKPFNHGNTIQQAKICALLSCHCTLLQAGHRVCSEAQTVCVAEEA